MSRLQRLDKLLGQEGFGTRSELKKAIRKGRATVNGEVEKDPGRQISEEDEVAFDGKTITRETYVYYMLNKPAGVITATEDGRLKTVLDLLRNPDSEAEMSSGVETGHVSKKPASDLLRNPDSETEMTSGVETKHVSEGPILRKGLFPVGRLDRDTEGLLLITDDGQLAHRLLSPARHVDKVYFAVVTGTVTNEEIRQFAGGLRVDDELTAMPADLRIAEGEILTEEMLSKILLPGTGKYTQVYITIREGKFHQIKRMFTAVGKEVLYLKRLSMGPLKLDVSLKPGQFRELTETEIAALRAQ